MNGSEKYVDTLQWLTLVYDFLNHNVYSTDTLYLAFINRFRQTFHNYSV